MDCFSSLATELENERSGSVVQQGTTEESGGYDIKLFTGEVDEDFKCVVCLDVMKDPYQIIPCGHRFCRKCLGQVFRSSDHPTCPLDREQISTKNMFPDYNCKRKIFCLNVCCGNTSLGCDWKSILSELEKHLSDQCLYQEFSCGNEGCKDLIMRKFKTEHENIQCKWRIVKCILCSKDFCAYELEEHKAKSCPLQPIDCTNKGCSMSIPRDQMPGHLEKDCLSTIMKCPLEFLGCSEQGTRLYINNHMKEIAPHHIEMLCEEVKSLKVQQQKQPISIIWRLPFGSQDQTHIPGVFESPIFSTGPRGYTFRLLYRCKDPDNIIIYIALVAGQFDHVLPWPFSSKLSMFIIYGNNYGTSQERFCGNVDISPDNKIPQFQKTFARIPPNTPWTYQPQHIFNEQTYTILEFDLKHFRFIDPNNHNIHPSNQFIKIMIKMPAQNAVEK